MPADRATLGDVPDLPKIRAALYARVSSSDQRPDLQVNAMREYASRRGWDVREYTDHGVSGAEERRPQLAALTEDLHKHKIDVVLVWKFDRMFRSVHHMAEFGIFLKNLGVDFVSVTEQIDTSTAAGKLHFNMLSAIAEFENAVRHERQMAGIAAALNRGVRFGRPAIELNEDRIRADYQAIKSVRKVSALHGVSKSTVIRVCHRVRSQPDRRKFSRG